MCAAGQRCVGMTPACPVHATPPAHARVQMAQARAVVAVFVFIAGAVLGTLQNNHPAASLNALLAPAPGATISNCNTPNAPQRRLADPLCNAHHPPPNHVVHQHTWKGENETLGFTKRRIISRRLNTAATRAPRASGTHNEEASVVSRWRAKARASKLVQRVAEQRGARNSTRNAQPSRRRHQYVGRGACIAQAWAWAAALAGGRPAGAAGGRLLTPGWPWAGWRRGWRSAAAPGTGGGCPWGGRGRVRMGSGDRRRRHPRSRSMRVHKLEARPHAHAARPAPGAPAQGIRPARARLTS